MASYCDRRLMSPTYCQRMPRHCLLSLKSIGAFLMNEGRSYPFAITNVSSTPEQPRRLPSRKSFTGYEKYPLCGRVLPLWKRLATSGKSFKTICSCRAMVAVLISGIWKPGISWNLMGTEIGLQGVVRDVVLIALALLSLKLTPAQVKATLVAGQVAWVAGA